MRYFLAKKPNSLGKRRKFIKKQNFLFFVYMPIKIYMVKIWRIYTMAEPRAIITLRCSVCKNENYIATKNKKTHPSKFTTRKYCPHCNKKTLHEEKK